GALAADVRSETPQFSTTVNHTLGHFRLSRKCPAFSCSSIAGAACAARLRPLRGGGAVASLARFRLNRKRASRTPRAIGCLEFRLRRNGASWSAPFFVLPVLTP